MNKPQALDVFWNSFGVPAYDENTVPQNAKLPYITYNVSYGALGDIIILNASVWDRSTSWKRVEAIAQDVSRVLGEYGHYVAKLDEGYVWMTQGVPFAQRMSDEDDSIRRIYLNINAEFLTRF